MKDSTLLIACEVVAKEMGHRIPGGLPLVVLDPALHVHPDRLKKELQTVIDREQERYHTLLLGYGLCSRALEGLRSKQATLIVPKVDDCIGILLGSRAAHLEQVKKEPGTFFLSKGWIDAGSTPFEEYAYMVKRFGQNRADRLIRQLLHNYTRLVLIETDCGGISPRYGQYAREQAARFGLRYETITGKPLLFDQLLRATSRPGDSDELLVVRHGNEITYEMFISK